MDIETLSRWINLSLDPVALVSRRTLNMQNAVLAQGVELLGWWSLARLATTINCPECLDDHTVKVVSRIDGGFHFFCIHNGWMDVAQDELELLQFDREKFLSGIARVAGLSNRRADRVADSRLVRFGMVQPYDARSGWMLAYADGLEQENALNGVVDAIDGLFPNGPGLVVTPSCIPLNIPLPRNYKLIALHACFRIENGELALNAKAIDDRLGIGAKSKREVGRPSFEVEIEEVWRIERTKPGWPLKGREAQAQRILDAWSSAVGTKPELGTVKNHLPKLAHSGDFGQPVRLMAGTVSGLSRAVFCPGVRTA